MPEASAAVAISTEDETDSTEQSNSEYDSKHDYDVDMRMADDVDAPCGVDSDGDLDMERDGDHEEEEDEEEADEEEMDEEEEEDEDEEQDKDEDEGKEPRTIGHGQMVNTSADNVDTMVDYQPIVLPEQGQEMRKHTSWPQAPGPAPQQQTPEPRPWPHTPDTNPLVGRECLGHVIQQQSRPAVPTLREAEAVGNTSDMDVDQQLLSESAGGDSLSNVPLPNITLPNVPLPDVPLPDVRLPGARLVGSVDEQWISAHVEEETMVVASGSGLGSYIGHFLCSNLFIWGNDHYTRREVYKLLIVHSIHSAMGHHACRVCATPGMSGTSLWWGWGSINLWS